MPSRCILWIGGMPWRMFISIGNAIETWAPTSLTLFQPLSDMPVMWMNRCRSCGLSSSDPLPAVPSARLSRIGRMPNGERICAAS